MELVYISPADVRNVGGVENTTKVWLRELRDRGVDITTITYATDGVERSETAGGITFYLLADTRPGDRIRDLLEREDPDVVLTESGWSDLAIEAANDLGIGSVFNLNAVQGGSTEKYRDELRPTRLTVCSEYVKQWAAGTWRCDPTVVYPAIDFDFYTLDEQYRDEVCLCTPLEIKGGNVIRGMAERLPDEDFTVKQGWNSRRNDDGSWNRKLFLIMAQTFSDDPESASLSDISDEQLPTDVDFSDLGNVSRVGDREILELYRRARVYVEPPQWRQGFSRVALEAMWNGIPVITCDRGGVPEAGGGAALLVDQYDDPDEYVEKLRKLDDPETYELFSEMARERAERYRRNQPDQIDALVETLRSAAAEGPAR